MTYTTRIATIVGAFCLMTIFGSSNFAQRTKDQPNPTNAKMKPPNLDYNVSGTIGWRDGSLPKNCSALRISVLEQTSVKYTPAGVAYDESYKTLGYQYATAIPNQADCAYRVKLTEGKPFYLAVEYVGKEEYVGNYGVSFSPEGWKNPITVKPGEKLIRNLKIGADIIK